MWRWGDLMVGGVIVFYAITGMVRLVSNRASVSTHSSPEIPMQFEETAC